MDVLQQLKIRRQLGTLARMLRPPITRQAVRRWKQVPYRYLRQVATITAVNPAAIRPDCVTLINTWKPLWKPPARGARLDVR